VIEDVESDVFLEHGSYDFRLISGVSPAIDNLQVSVGALLAKQRHYVVFQLDPASRFPINYQTVFAEVRAAGTDSNREMQGSRRNEGGASPR
jgi:hypothetical protein